MDYYIVPLTLWAYFLHTLNGLASDLLGSLCQDDNTLYTQIVSQENAAEFYCNTLKFKVGEMVKNNYLVHHLGYYKHFRLKKKQKEMKKKKKTVKATLILHHCVKSTHGPYYAICFESRTWD